MAEADGPPPARLRSALALAVSGSVTLFLALLLHEYIVFGPGGHDLIAAWGTRCDSFPCATMNLVVLGHVAKSLGAAIVFALIGGAVPRDPPRLALGLVFWTVQYLWSLVGIASGYRGQFGTTWLWWEPFAELIWRPPLTLGALAVGLAAFALLARSGSRPVGVS